MSHTWRTRMFTLAGMVALLAVVGAACDDDDPEPATTGVADTTDHDADGGDAAVGTVYEVGDLRISDVRMPAPPTSATAAVYLTVTNTGSAADRLIAVSVPIADAVEIHESQQEDGISRMVHLPDGIEIAAGATVRLAPGGLHAMLFDLTEQPSAGGTVEVTLRFEQAGETVVTAEIVDFVETGSGGTHDSMDGMDDDADDDMDDHADE